MQDPTINTGCTKYLTWKYLIFSWYHKNLESSFWLFGSSVKTRLAPEYEKQHFKSSFLKAVFEKINATFWKYSIGIITCLQRNTPPSLSLDKEKCILRWNLTFQCMFIWCKIFYMCLAVLGHYVLLVHVTGSNSKILHFFKIN